jgi:hypothetical protein
MIEFVIEHWDEICLVITSAVTLAAAVAAITPSKSDDVIVQKLLDLINVLGLNVGKAKNKDSK